VSEDRPRSFHTHQPDTRTQHEVDAELNRLEGENQDAHEIAERALRLAKENERLLQDLGRTLYGHPDERRRGSEPGIVKVVSEITADFRSVKAVARAGWAVIGVVGVSTLVGMFSFFIRFLEG